MSKARFARKYSLMPKVFQYPDLIVSHLRPGLEEGDKEPIHGSHSIILLIKDTLKSDIMHSFMRSFSLTIGLK